MLAICITCSATPKKGKELHTIIRTKASLSMHVRFNEGHEISIIESSDDSYGYRLNDVPYTKSLWGKIFEESRINRNEEVQQS